MSRQKSMISKKPPHLRSFCTWKYD